MIKKLLLLFGVTLSMILLVSCDEKIKRCTYEVYQHGKKIYRNFYEYTDINKWCKSYSKDGVVYKLKDVDIIRVKDIQK